MARVLITGAQGMLGRRLVEAFERDHEVVATARRGTCGIRTLDVTEAAAVLACVESVRPDWVVNAAAYTAVDLAETETTAAFAVNDEAAGHLAYAAERKGAVLLHVSTDFVFSGEKEEAYVETDPVGPIGVYARSKEAGERRVRAACPDRHLILRVSWLFGPDGKNFVDTMLRLGRERDRLRVVADQRGTPTYTVDAAAQAVRALEAGLRGTVHAANRGTTTWHAFATEALRLAGCRTPVDPITTLDYPTAATRPRNSALRNAVLERTVGDTMRPWQEALADHVRSFGGA